MKTRERKLKVFLFPQNGGRVPAVRVAGMWLEEFNFHVDDFVILRAIRNRIIIEKIVDKEAERG